ncbi:uncharacterized protein [Amphiura filiformis]|uniref:uncharacterized protein n=1 Tax=Amphiura filiformis TaxID=82378 RepID=UPI003B226130
MDVTISQGSSSVRVFNIYRPPPSSENKLTQSMFLEDFGTFLETISAIPGEIILLGDFNCHVNDADDRFARAFQDLLDAVGLKQHVNGATHKSGHTLDLMISRDTSNVITGVVEIIPEIFSDHYPVGCYLNLQPPKAPSKTMKYRKIREIDTTEFMRDIESSSLYTNPAPDLEELVNQYETVMGMLLDKHAPLVEKSVIVRPHCPWYTDELRLAKQKKRQAERKYTKSKLEIDKQIYADHSKSYKTMLETAKRDHHRSKIEDCDSKELFRVVDKLCNPAAELAFPDHNSEDELAEKFATYFDEKIQKIRNDLDSADQPKKSSATGGSCVSSFETFRELSSDDIRKIIMDSPTKSCPLDPIPTDLFKTCVESLLL